PPDKSRLSVTAGAARPPSRRDPEPGSRGARWEIDDFRDGTSQMRDDDPREAGAQPPFKPQQQQPPGFTEQLEPKPDHGEKSYRGCGRLEGRAALITGADSGIGRADAIVF